MTDDTDPTALAELQGTLDAALKALEDAEAEITELRERLWPCHHTPGEPYCERCENTGFRLLVEVERLRTERDELLYQSKLPTDIPSTTKRLIEAEREVERLRTELQQAQEGWEQVSVRCLTCGHPYCGDDSHKFETLYRRRPQPTEGETE